MDYRKQMTVKPGQKLRLKDVDPAKGRRETRESALQERKDTGKSSANCKPCYMRRKSTPF
jgi:hypothetical protein